MSGRPDSPWHKQIAMDNLVLLTEVGSGLHGVTLAGTDDHDEMGVCIEPPETVIGEAHFEQYIGRWHSDGSRISEGERSGFGDTDRSVFSLRKWTRQACKGNPTFLLPLFVPATKVYHCDPWFGTQILLAHDHLLTKQAGFAYMGYLKRQRLNAFQDHKHTNRPELVEQFGFDTKSAYHAIRLALQGIELMESGSVTLPMRDDHRDYLIAVRQGRVALTDVLGNLDHLTNELAKAGKNSELPNRVDQDWLNDWLTTMHLMYWQDRHLYL